MISPELASSIAFALFPVSILGLCISWGRKKAENK